MTSTTQGRAGRSGRLGHWRWLVAGAALLCGAASAVAAEEPSGLVEGAKNGGHAVGLAFHDIGQGAKHIGVEVGHNAAEAGRNIGHGAAQMGREIGHAAKEGGKAFVHAIRGGDGGAQ